MSRQWFDLQFALFGTLLNQTMDNEDNWFTNVTDYCIAFTAKVLIGNICFLQI